MADKDDSAEFIEVDGRVYMDMAGPTYATLKGMVTTGAAVMERLHADLRLGLVDESMKPLMAAYVLAASAGQEPPKMEDAPPLTDDQRRMSWIREQMRKQQERERPLMERLAALQRKHGLPV